jgi:hypothetical protein
LVDIRDVLDHAADGRMLSSELVERLCAIEGGPWAEWQKGKFTPNTLARLLKPFDISPRTIRTSTSRAKGYSVEMFEDAFLRYLPPLSSDTVTTCINGACNPVSQACQPETVKPTKSADPYEQRVVTAVTDENGGCEQKPEQDYLLQAAIDLCRENGFVSVTTIKDALLISCAKAISYIDEMEAMGLLAPATGSGARAFLHPIVA